MRVGTQRRIVALGRQDQRRAAAPAAHELGRQQFLLLDGLRVIAQVLTKYADMLLAAAGRPVKLPLRDSGSG